MSKLPGLEVVRALAAITVIFGHIVYYDLIPVPNSIKMMSSFSTEAVIIFFVLSGLVITRSVLRRPPAAPIFFWRRLIRIYPIYLCAIGLAVVTAWILSDHSEPLSGWLGNLVFLQSLGGNIVGAPSTNQPLWSLSYEMTYYFMFALCLWRRAFLPVFWSFAIIAAVVASVYNSNGVLGHWVGIFSLALTWLFGWSIARHPKASFRISVELGVCLLVIGLMFARSPLTENFYDPFRLCAFGLLCSPLVAALAFGGDAPAKDLLIRPAAFALGVALLWTLSPALLFTKAVLTLVGLMAAFMPLTAVKSILRRLAPLQRPLAYVGTISYALYAIHVPILLMIRYFTPEIPLLRLALFVPSVWLLSHLLELKMQPSIAQALRPKR